MFVRRFALVSVLVLAIPAAAAAQDFGVMNSAETINRGNFKLLGNPIILLEDDRNDDVDLGLGLSGGYGFTENFDVEGKLAFFDGVTFIGADAEYWLVKNEPVDVSVSGGFHLGRSDGFDTSGLDFTFLASGHVRPRLELYAALDVATNNVDDSDFDYTTLHFVPGVEVELGPDLDFVGEIGLAMNDDSSHYVSVGLAFYFR